MKTNFKKIAILAGATAAMAAGSMSAHAVITAVPAPAQLIPLFYFNTASAISTTVRITVPKSVGSDTVINLLGGTIPASTSWSTTQSALSSGGKIHYYVMSSTSKEIWDGSISVTADDEYFLTAAPLAEFANSPMTSGIPYYLILTNEAANLGGTPTFQFAAEAWITNSGSTGYVPDSVALPVLGLADTADTTSYPTPTNNVIEAFTSAQGGPVASPIISGIRLNSTTPGLIYRVVDVPFVGSNVSTTYNYTNTLVAWNDRNGMTGRYYSLSSDEVLQSLGGFSLPNQLNIVKLGAYGGLSSATVGGTALGITDQYSTLSTIGSTGQPCAASSTGCQAGTGNNNGFLKLVIDAPALPTAATGTTLAPGAYSSAFMFTIPTGILNISTLPIETDALYAIDTGFFTSN